MMSGHTSSDTRLPSAAHRRPYEPTDGEVDRLVDMAVAQGFPRVVPDLPYIAPIAGLLRPHLVDRARAREGRAA